MQPQKQNNFFLPDSAMRETHFVNNYGSWKLEDGRWKLENGSWKMEDGSRKLEDGRWKLDLILLNLLPPTSGFQLPASGFHLPASTKKGRLLYNRPFHVKQKINQYLNKTNFRFTAWPFSGVMRSM